MAAPSPVSAEDELARLEPVLPAVVALGVPVSIDTMKAKVAAWALERAPPSSTTSGACSAIPDMARVVAEHGVPVIIMHNRDAADPAIDIVADMRRLLPPLARHRRHAPASRATAIVLDPGIGFGKTPEQSMTAHRPARRA